MLILVCWLCVFAVVWVFVGGGCFVVLTCRGFGADRVVGGWCCSFLVFALWV